MARTAKTTTETANKEINETTIIPSSKANEIPFNSEKKYNATDSIPCKSITAGELGMIGIKSGINYKWADRNDITEIEYQDLVAAIRQNDSYITKPYFIIEDKIFLEQFPQIKKIYDTIYSGKDLKDILKLNISEMRSTIITLPDGAKESLKNIASTQISTGQLDSVKKIKILDEIFGTQLMLLTGLFN